jgi:hypothetical protein
MTLTRESAALWLAAAGALVAYLIADGRWPGDWVYQDWLKLAAAVVAWGVGKLQHSPLKGEKA